MKYILEGNDNEVAKIVRENRIRVERGLVSFTPLNEETSDVFVDDDPNGIPNDEDHVHAEDDFYNDESYGPSEEVQKILLEPLGKDDKSEEGTTVTDSFEGKASVSDCKVEETSATAADESLENDSKCVEVEDSKYLDVGDNKHVEPKDSIEAASVKKKPKRGQKRK